MAPTEPSTEAMTYAPRNAEIRGAQDHPLQQIRTLESHRILQDKLSSYILGLLLLVWISAQLQRYKARNLNAGCWCGWDVIGLACVAYFCQKQQWAVACVFTSFFLVWTRLPGSPLNDFRLPSFTTFLGTSSDGHTTSAAVREIAHNADNSGEQPACLVCWSSDEQPVKLPCKHLVCRECLTTMKDRRQTCCPLCRLPLFHNNDSMRCAVHKAAAALFAAELTRKGLYFILKLWHGQYWEVCKSAVPYLPQFYCLRLLYIVALTQGVEWWQFGLLDYLLPLPVPESRFGRSMWAAAIFAVLSAMSILGGLWKIARLDLVVEVVVHEQPFPQLHAP